MSTQLETIEQELYEWASGGRSYWNDVHGSVTGDYAGQIERAASADAAQIDKLTKQVIALRLLGSEVLS